MFLLCHHQVKSRQQLLPAKAGAAGLWTTHIDTLDDFPASSMPAQDMFYSKSIFWHGQQVTLRIMRLDCFCELARKVYVHICRRRECNSQLCLRVAVVFLLCENLIQHCLQRAQPAMQKSLLSRERRGGQSWAEKVKESSYRMQCRIHKQSNCLLGYSCDKGKCVPATSPDWSGCS